MTADTESLRLQGNTLYEDGKIREAVLLYKRAADLAPTKAAPLSNLAAACLEWASINYP